MAIQILSKSSYKNGQIDALNGNIKYRLEKNSDGYNRMERDNKINYIHMTFEELLKACGKGTLPKVRIETPVKNSKAIDGIIVEIKNCGNYKGCAVRFPDMAYNKWFYAETGNDKRCNYMSELSIIE